MQSGLRGDCVEVDDDGDEPCRIFCTVSLKKRIAFCYAKLNCEHEEWIGAKLWNSPHCGVVTFVAAGSRGKKLLRLWSCYVCSPLE